MYRQRQLGSDGEHRSVLAEPLVCRNVLAVERVWCDVLAVAFVCRNVLAVACMLALLVYYTVTLQERRRQQLKLLLLLLFHSGSLIKVLSSLNLIPKSEKKIKCPEQWKDPLGRLLTQLAFYCLFWGHWLPGKGHPFWQSGGGNIIKDRKLWYKLDKSFI